MPEFGPGAQSSKTSASPTGVLLPLKPKARRLWERTCGKKTRTESLRGQEAFLAGPVAAYERGRLPTLMPAGGPKGEGWCWPTVGRKGSKYLAVSGCYEQ